MEECCPKSHHSYLRCVCACACFSVWICLSLTLRNQDAQYPWVSMTSAHLIFHLKFNIMLGPWTCLLRFCGLGTWKGTSGNQTPVIVAYNKFSDTLLCSPMKQQGGEKPKGPLEALRPKLQVFSQNSHTWFRYGDTSFYNLIVVALLMCELLAAW